MEMLVIGHRIGLRASASAAISKPDICDMSSFSTGLQAFLPAWHDEMPILRIIRDIAHRGKHIDLASK